jgi:ATP-dependent DNA ligase
MPRKAKSDDKSVQLAPNKLIPFDDPRIPYPEVLASRKFDGLRCFVRYDGAILSRSMIPLPNRNLPGFLTEITDLARRTKRCFDSEILIPKATHHGAHGVFMKHEGEIPKSTIVNVFDTITAQEWEEGDITTKFVGRVKDYTRLLANINPERYIPVEQVRCNSAADAEAYFKESVEMGHEGIMLRAAMGLYKFGRCGHKGAWLLKFKAEETHDGRIVKVVQRLKMKEGVARERNEFGRLVPPTKNADNYELDDCAGSFLVRFEDGTEGECCWAEGFADMAERRRFWKDRKKLVGRCVEVKCYPGAKDSIRSGRVVRWRPDKD